MPAAAAVAPDGEAGKVLLCCLLETFVDAGLEFWESAAAEVFEPPCEDDGF